MSVLAAGSHILYRETGHKEQQQQLWNGGGNGLLIQSVPSPCGYCCRRVSKREMMMRTMRVGAFWADLTRPSSVSEMESIDDCDHLDRVLAHAQELSQPILIDWMANWCRKCIYLKPKLQKLAAEFDSKIKFYYVDVNKVPQSLVKRGNISKMPTIQVWKDGEMKAEVIGGHKAWLVIEEVKQMIQKFV